MNLSGGSILAPQGAPPEVMTLLPAKSSCEIPLGERQPWSVQLCSRVRTHRPRGRLILPGTAVCDITPALAITYLFPEFHPTALPRPPAHPSTATWGPRSLCVTIGDRTADTGPTLPVRHARGRHSDTGPTLPVRHARGPASVPPLAV